MSYYFFYDSGPGFRSFLLRILYWIYTNSLCKCQEGWVLRRVAELSRDGLWPDKRLPKVSDLGKYKAQINLEGEHRVPAFHVQNGTILPG